MKSLRILSSQSIPKRNLGIRRFDPHHQFHSSFHLDDGHSLYHRQSNTTSFSWTQRRCLAIRIIHREPEDSTEYSRHRRVPEKSTRYSRDVPRYAREDNLTDQRDWNPPSVDKILKKLEANLESVTKFDRSLEDLSKTVRDTKKALTTHQLYQLNQIIRKWNVTNDYPVRQCARVLMFLGNSIISTRTEQETEIVVFIVDKFFEQYQKSFRWFALFLTGMRRVGYSGSSLTTTHREKVLDSLAELRRGSDERAYAELIAGLSGLGFTWNEINEPGKQNLLHQLDSLRMDFSVRSIISVIFNFGKMGANLKETDQKATVMELVGIALKVIERDDGEGHLDVLREVRYCLRKRLLYLLIFFFFF
jgi:hypothetical protein